MTAGDKLVLIITLWGLGMTALVAIAYYLLTKLEKVEN